MNDEQLLRYSRQIMLPQVDVEGQAKLLASTVLIMGMGGLGSPVAMYLAAAGVGHLVLVDFDKVEQSNLQRQIIHREQSLGQLKVDSAAETLRQLNAQIKVTTVSEHLSEQALIAKLDSVDCVVDGTDNFESRFAINRACVHTQTTLVSGAAIRFEGQVTVFANQQGGPCYQCLYPDTGDELAQTCSDNGVLSPVVGIIGSVQATEVVKSLLGIGKTLQSRLLLLDASQMEWRSITLKKDPACPVCS